MAVGFFFIGVLVWGTAIGWIGQLLIGKRGAANRNWGQAMLAGAGGSLIGGMIGSILMGEGFQLKMGGIVASIVGSVIVLLLWEWLARTQSDK